MKRHFTILLASLLMFSLIAGCIANESNNTKSNISENVSEPSIVDRISGEESQAIAAPDNVADGAPQVYMTTDISPEGLMAVYEALGRNVTGDVAVKNHHG